MSPFSESCERHLEAGRRAVSLGDLATAEVELRAAVDGAQSGAAGPELLASALGSLAHLLYQARRFAEAAPLLARTLELREATAGTDDAGLVPALHNLAAVHVAAGNAVEAEPLLRRALAILERAHGPEHAELAGVLNALSQLCLKRGAHADAEPLLKRLLTIRRAEGGEERPEVATVMASLASVHQALAEHDAAERLLRRVLEIRERTLAPNHFAIATSLEALAETCAARGKLAEALAMLERALDIRERTLEPGHASLSLVRSRIADLQLQLSSDAFAVPLMEPVAEAWPSAPPRPPARTTFSATTVRAVAAPAITSPFTEFRAPDVASIVPAASGNGDGMDAMRRLAAEMDSAPAATQPLDRGEQSNLSVAYLRTGSALVLPGERSAVARETFDGDLGDDETDLEAAGATRRSSAALLVRPATRIALLGLVLFTLAAAGALVARGSRADAGDGFVQTPPSTAPESPTRSSAAGTIALPDAGESQQSLRPDSVSAPEPSPSIGTSTRENDSPVSRSATRTPGTRSARVDAATPPVPATPTPVAEQMLRRVNVRIDPAAPALDVNLGATQREAGAAIGARGAIEADRTTAAYSLLPTLKPPALIGVIPQPRYPSELRRARVAGEVTVSFVVNPAGGVDASSLRVISATDVRFVGAVTDVLPQLRFIPADSAGVKVSQRVELPFRFNP